MTASIPRRTVLAGSLLAFPALAGDAGRGLAELEAANGGRLGVAALSTANGLRMGHRADERFPICSTFKFLLAALALSRVARGQEQLENRIVFSEKDLVTYSPVTKDRVGGSGLSVQELCDAAVTLSDNTAANLLLARFGGPSAFTAFARTLGDEVTRLDRMETALNEAIPGDPRDTTTPAAMLGNMHRLLIGDVLSPRLREYLIGWLIGCKTGATRLRAGFPAEWWVGDKTGSGGNGTANDIAIAWPSSHTPILVAVYYTGATIGEEARSRVIAEAGRLVAAGLS